MGSLMATPSNWYHPAQRGGGGGGEGGWRGRERGGEVEEVEGEQWEIEEITEGEMRSVVK